MTDSVHNIVDTAMANGAFKTLVSAVTAAGLQSTLTGTGPFTVFAPSMRLSPSCLPAQWKGC